MVRCGSVAICIPLDIVDVCPSRKFRSCLSKKIIVAARITQIALDTMSGMFVLVLFGIVFISATRGAIVPRIPRGHNHVTDAVEITCDLIHNYHCSFFHDDIQCGTDGMTYDNMCFFAEAHCQVRDLHIAHPGPCGMTTPAATPTASSGGGSSTHAPGSDAVYQFFCQNLNHEACGTDHETLCGTDGVTYTNLCYFEKARCLDPTLAVSAYLACP